MAEKGSSPSSSTKHSLDARRFAFDVLSYALPAYGIPETKLQIADDKRNRYINSDYIVGVRATVLSIALTSRDKWKRMFESRQKSSGLESLEKVQGYLSTIVNVLPEFREDDSDKIFTSLALYSEMFVFLDFNNIVIVFEEFLDMWSSYFNEKIAPNKDTDALFGELYLEHPNMHGYLRFVTYFVRDFAIPYGDKDVSEEFLKFMEAMEDLDDERNSIVRSLEQRIVDRLGFMPHNLRNPLPEAVEESVSLYTSVLERDTVLPGNRTSDSPECMYDFPSPVSGATGVEESFEDMNIDKEKTSQKSRKRSRRRTNKKKHNQEN